MNDEAPLRALLSAAVDRWRMNRRVCPHNAGLHGYECEICLVDHVLATLKKLRYRLLRD